MGYYSEKIRRMVEGAATEQGITNGPIKIGNSCIVRIDGQFFLVVQIMFDSVSRIIVIRISGNQAAGLGKDGIKACPVYDELPKEVQGKPVELECVFFIYHQAFLVFEILNTSSQRERLIVARIPICSIGNQGF